MGVWWMEGNTKQSTKERVVLRLSTGAVAETVRLARGKYTVGGIRGSLACVLFGVPV